MSDRGFTGHKHNNLAANDLGLIYMNARYYVPNTNRFLTPDTIVPDPANPQSFNRYSYAYNNPLRYRDADGHRPCELVCPGDWILAGSFTGAGYNGPWDIAQQQQNSENAEALLVEVRNTAVGIAYEPADWSIALSDGFQWYDIIGMFPFVPATVGKYFRHIDLGSFERLLRMGARNHDEIDAILHTAGSKTIIRGMVDSAGNQVTLLAGGRSEGLRHIIGRHLTGAIPGTYTTLFPNWAKVSDITDAVADAVGNGARTYDYSRGNWVYTWNHPTFGEMKVIVSQSGEVISAYPTH